MKRRKRNNSTPTRVRIAPQQIPNVQSKPESPNRKRNIIFWSCVAGFLVGGIIFLLVLSQDLPSLTKLEHIDPALATHVYSSDGEIIDSFHRKNRTIVPFNKFPDHLVKALLATEDRMFFDHWGVNIFSIFRSIFVSLIQVDRIRGTSTITMQLSRNLYFGLERTWSRKIKEIMTAIQIEKTYSKKEIIEMYFNINFFGSNAYGIQAAAKTYFSKDVDELTTEEAALLVGMLKGQTRYNPLVNPDRALSRRNVVLNSMKMVGYITPVEYDSLSAMELNLIPSNEQEKIAPYFTEYIRVQLNQLQDSLDVNVYEDGLRVYTSLDTRIQHYMDMAIDSLMPAFQARLRRKSSLLKKVGSRGEDSISDSLFRELTTVQIAFVCLDPHTGHILAMVGGRDFKKSQYNRAIQAPRQPGSAFKPFVYTAAIDNGYSPADEFLNQPFVLINPDGTRWTPHNYDNSVSGLMTLRDALKGSKNLVSIRLIQEIGPALAANYAHQMGISTKIRAVPSLALGSSEVYLLDLVSAYGVFSNNGVRVEPVSILKIEDKMGNIIYRSRMQSREALRKETAHIMRDMLESVVNNGTGYALRRDYKFYVPTGGKTGTTNDYTDALFIGFTPHLVAGVWVGYDDHQLSLGSGETGARSALPFWGLFAKTLYDSISFPEAEFEESANIVELTICKETKKIATPYCIEPVKEKFILKYAPTETCDVHTGRQQVKGNRRRSF
jgi:penicillin-binding protein 1A